MIFKAVRDGAPYPDHHTTLKKWAEIPPRPIRLADLITTKRELALDKLLAEDSTFYGDLFPHVVQWNGALYLEDGLHRALRAALIETARVLDDLDVARWRPEAADAPMNLRHRPALVAPSGTPPRCAELAARGLQGWAIAELALEDDGGALSAREIGTRRTALHPLERASRRAVVAACSSEVWPDH